MHHLNPMCAYTHRTALAKSNEKNNYKVNYTGILKRLFAGSLLLDFHAVRNTSHLGLLCFCTYSICIILIGLTMQLVISMDLVTHYSIIMIIWIASQWATPPEEWVVFACFGPLSERLNGSRSSERPVWPDGCDRFDSSWSSSKHCWLTIMTFQWQSPGPLPMGHPHLVKRMTNGHHLMAVVVHSIVSSYLRGGITILQTLISRDTRSCTSKYMWNASRYPILILSCHLDCLYCRFLREIYKQNIHIMSLKCNQISDPI